MTTPRHVMSYSWVSEFGKLGTNFRVEQGCRKCRAKRICEFTQLTRHFFFICIHILSGANLSLKGCVASSPCCSLPSARDSSSLLEGNVHRREHSLVEDVNYDYVVTQVAS